MELVGKYRWVTASLVLVGCSQVGEVAMDSERFEAELMAADRAFDSATQAGGADGWTSFFEQDGSMIQEGVGEIRGRDAIRERMQGAFGAGVEIRWTPTRAVASDDGTLGFTTGEWTSRVASSDGERAEARGLYVSIWRRQPDGAWRVVMDLGNPVTPESR